MKKILLISLILSAFIFASCGAENKVAEETQVGEDTEAAAGIENTETDAAGIEDADDDGPENAGNDAAQTQAPVFSGEQNSKKYNIILEPQSVLLTAGERENYYEFAVSDDIPSVKSIELKALYTCAEDDINTQAEDIISSYRDSLAVLSFEDLSSGKNTLLSYAVLHSTTSEYSFICFIYDAESGILCEFMVTAGDIETFRVLSSNGTVGGLFDEISITETAS